MGVYLRNRNLPANAYHIGGYSWMSAVPGEGEMAHLETGCYEETNGVKHFDMVINLVPGRPFNLCVLATGPDTRAALFLRHYMPYLDGCDPRQGLVNLPVIFSPCPQARIHFRQPDGRPAPGVSRLALAPESPTSLLAPTINDKTNNVSLTPIMHNADGSYTVTTLSAGKFRLLVDLFDESLPSLPQLQLTLTPGAQEYTIPLPAPLTTLPPGQTVYWVTPNAPAVARRLTMAADATPMPLYGPAQGVLAWWTCPDDNTLLLHYHQSVQRLTRREISIPSSANSAWPTQPLLLAPLLPVTADVLNHALIDGQGDSLLLPTRWHNTERRCGCGRRRMCRPPPRWIFRRRTGISRTRTTGVYSVCSMPRRTPAACRSRNCRMRARCNSNSHRTSAPCTMTLPCPIPASCICIPPAPFRLTRRRVLMPCWCIAPRFLAERPAHGCTIRMAFSLLP